MGFYVLGKTGEMFQRYHLSQNRGRAEMKMIKKDKTVDTQLYAALKKQDVFDAFLNHLASEFSLQTLLAFIEFGAGEAETKLDLNEFFGRTQGKAFNLYEKYIAAGCELEVPFSATTRQKYIDKMHDENVWFFESSEVKNLYDMMHFSDGAIKDIYQLLSSSYATFHGKADDATIFLS